MGEKEKEFHVHCDNEGESEIEKKLMEEYWRIDPEDESKFLYNICDIEKRLGVAKNTLLTLARNNYRVTGSHPRFTCIVCKERLFVKNRGFYFRTYRKPRCEECLALEKAEKIREEELRLAAYAKVKEEELAERSRIIKAFEEEHLQSDYSINDFSYLEVIFVYLWLSDKELSEEEMQLISKCTFESVTGVAELDEFIIQGLVSKGIVMELGEDLILELEQSSVLEFLGIGYGCYLKRSRKYASMYELCSRLHERFYARSIHLTDIDDISMAVEVIRVNNLYGVVSWLEAEHRIDIKQSAKLDGLLKNLASRFSLLKCTHLMFWKAKEVAAYIHTTRPEYYKIPTLFTKFIDNHLIKFDTYNWEQKYTRMPKYAESTALELLVCSQFFDMEYNWFPLTTGEVLSQWVGSLEVLDEDCDPKEE